MNKNIENWDAKKIANFQKDFLAWYDDNKRNLPWRFNTDPYRIWISEIMLQQTRVDTVIDYFYRFMETFPTIEDLANAPEDKLLKIWEGLGYYSRARNIQTAAKQIMTEFHGEFPKTVEEIGGLKGIGPYTTGAIGSIAFDLPEPAVDGNVMRVVSRLFLIEDDIAKASSRKIFDVAMRKIISHEHPGDFNQAMMDLGSSICTPTNPDCDNCPIQQYCLAYQENRQTEFPIKSKKAKPKDSYFVAGAIENGRGEFLLEKRAETGLLANMWTFPMEEISQEKFAQLKINFSEEQLDLFEVAEDTANFLVDYPVVWQKKVVGEVKHIFTHLRWHILVFYGRNTTDVSGTWVKSNDFDDFVFPKPQQKMVDLLENVLLRKD
ncbi:A/G-specific adenine glycosylase [Enterococcus alishanensis]|uniref:A/G-specific adenine glycosylase n=1 Tax=Enterococcus alishanensis TaxID=1303817 RepID=A0ABS6TAH4_9ENTE|nr:A/G-specific adenine glycosylase [Enterococcus alishanensis]